MRIRLYNVAVALVSFAASVEALGAGRKLC